MDVSVKRWHKVMLFWSFFQSVGALVGGGMGMLSPTGEWYGGESMIPHLQVLPFADVLFQNLFVPALSLFVLVGISGLVAGVLIVRGSLVGARWACANGVIITLFTAIEIGVLGTNPLSDVYCLLGVVQFACGLRYLKLLRA